MEKDFYHHVCHTCQSAPEPVHGAYRKFKSCSTCKLISYCSVSHQRADWRAHKPFCLRIKMMTESRKCPTIFDLFDTRSLKSLYRSQLELIVELERSLCRRLSKYERSTIFFPDICGSCLRPNGKTYIFCDGCLVRFYCSNEHKLSHDAVHRKDCRSLKLSFSVFKGRLKSDEALPGRVRLKKTSNPRGLFPKSLDDYCSSCLDPDRLSLADRLEFTDVLSYVATLVYAVLSSPLADRSALTVHIIGASTVDTYMLLVLDHFYQWLNNVERLDLVFVGPDCPATDPDLIGYAETKHGKRLSVTFYKGLYHEMTMDGSGKPGMIVAFNCGFHEYEGLAVDTWRPTLDYILTLSTVLVTTSYTPKEAEKDSSPFLSRDPPVRTVKLCENNPYCSMNPHRNPERTESDVFHFNQIVSIFSIQQDCT